MQSLANKLRALRSPRGNMYVWDRSVDERFDVVRGGGTSWSKVKCYHTVVHAEGLGDLKKPDQLEPVQALGAGLVMVHLRQPRIDRRIARDQAVDVGEPEEPTATCIIVLTEESISPQLPRCRMYSSMCARWIPTSGPRALRSHQANHRRSW